MGDIALHWFRKALRVHDNKGLSKAVASSNNLVALYVVDVKQLSPEVVGTNRLAFLLDTLKCLHEELHERGSRLFVAVGDPYDVICSLIEQLIIFPHTKVALLCSKVLIFTQLTLPWPSEASECKSLIPEGTHIS